MKARRQRRPRGFLRGLADSARRSALVSLSAAFNAAGSIGRRRGGSGSSGGDVRNTIASSSRRMRCLSSGVFGLRWAVAKSRKAGSHGRRAGVAPGRGPSCRSGPGLRPDRKRAPCSIGERHERRPHGRLLLPGFEGLFPDAGGVPGPLRKGHRQGRPGRVPAGIPQLHDRDQEQRGGHRFPAHALGVVEDLAAALHGRLEMAAGRNEQIRFDDAEGLSRPLADGPPRRGRAPGASAPRDAPGARPRGTNLRATFGSYLATAPSISSASTLSYYSTAKRRTARVASSAVRMSTMTRTSTFPRTRGSDALELPFLQHAEKLHLNLLWQITDLVQEDRAAVGQLETPLPRRHGARECAFLMTEQLAFDQRRRKRGAVDTHQRTGMPPAPLVQRAGEQFLASPRRTQQQHARIRRGDLREPTVQVEAPHSRRRCRRSRGSS